MSINIIHTVIWKVVKFIVIWSTLLQFPRGPGKSFKLTHGNKPTMQSNATKCLTIIAAIYAGILDFKVTNWLCSRMLPSVSLLLQLYAGMLDFKVTNRLCSRTLPSVSLLLLQLYTGMLDVKVTTRLCSRMLPSVSLLLQIYAGIMDFDLESHKKYPYHNLESRSTYL